MAGTGRFGGTGGAAACRSSWPRGSRPTGQLGRREVLRCVLVGLLCVQEDPHLRPSMASVVVMLNSRSITLPAFAAVRVGSVHAWSPGTRGRRTP